MIRVSLAQGFDNGGFGSPIHFGDKVALLLGNDLEQVDVVGGAVDDLAGATGGLDGDVQGWMHDFCKELEGAVSGLPVL